MPNRWIVLLRAVNVSGTGKLPMATFRSALCADGFEDVKTYIQTGNAIVTTNLERRDVEQKVEVLLEREFGLNRPAMALSLQEWEAALGNNPFPQAVETPQKLHLMFLRGKVSFDPEAFEPLCDNGEEFALIDGVFYLYTPNGAGRSKAAGRYEKFVRAQMVTARNLNSCMKINDLARV